VAFCFFLLQYSLSLQSYPPSPLGTSSNFGHQQAEDPPPLPSRNRPLLSLIQTPGAPPPLPPRQYCPHLQCTEGGESLGVENHHNVHLPSTNHYVSNTTTAGTQKYEALF